MGYDFDVCDIYVDCAIKFFFVEKHLQSIYFFECTNTKLEHKFMYNNVHVIIRISVVFCIKNTYLFEIMTKKVV